MTHGLKTRIRNAGCRFFIPVQEITQVQNGVGEGSQVIVLYADVLGSYSQAFRKGCQISGHEGGKTSNTAVTVKGSFVECV